MNLHTILHADAFENEKDFLKTEIEKNISGKLDAYIRPRLSENNDSVRIEAFFDRSKTGFDGKLILTLPDTTLRFTRKFFKIGRFGIPPFHSSQNTIIKIKSLNGILFFANCFNFFENFQ